MDLSNRVAVITGGGSGIGRAMAPRGVSVRVDKLTGKARIDPQELFRLVADAICFMLADSAVSGDLWVDAGWHAPA